MLDAEGGREDLLGQGEHAVDVGLLAAVGLQRTAPLGQVGADVDLPGDLGLRGPERQPVIHWGIGVEGEVGHPGGKGRLIEAAG